MAAPIDKLTPRISGGLSTVRRWDDDPSLLAEARSSVPFRELMPEWYDRVGGARPAAASSSKTAAPSDGGSGGGGSDGGSADGGGAAETPGLPSTSPSPYARDDDHEHSGDDLLLKRLTLWFQKHGMKWCDNPPCDICGCKDTSSAGVRGPRTAEEIEGEASRVELYHCPTCDAQTTTFPRYNSPRKLLETRRGRCGEYANLFGLFCRSAGFDVRYVSDFTDHVWIEVWSARGGRWVHADGCEGTVDAPSMYERGWGKGLNYVLGFTKESVVDVTRRYTRKFNSDEFQKRRRRIVSSESHGEMILAQVNATLRASATWSKGQEEELDRRIDEEKKFFEAAQRSGSWEGGAYGEGRVSGSLAWRAARRELGPGGGQEGGSSDRPGENGEKKDDAASSSSRYFLVESFHPSPFRSSAATVVVVSAPPKSSATSSSASCRERIVVSGVPCAAGPSNSTSIVTVDEKTGCILQSRSFSDWVGAASFLHTVPDGRIVAISSDRLKGISGPEVLEKLSRFGGLRPSTGGADGGEEEGKTSLLFVGRAGYRPAWATLNCPSKPARLEATVDFARSEAPAPKLRTERDAVPSLVSGRLPENIMPLKTQMMASMAQKRQAFERFMEGWNCKNDDGAETECYVGYATKSNAPVYLISRSGFPLQRGGGDGGGGGGGGSNKDDRWTTHHYLPEPLVPDDDGADGDGDGGGAPSDDAPKFDVPVDTGFFVSIFGQHLLKKIGGTTTRVDTAACLHNTRLIALYFSAHWCPPCRRFTPLLCEFYEVMKEELPAHGLEIVFVSSDRDPGEFDRYYGEMPWLALPFENRMVKQTISGRYGVRGIPALVVLDAVSGQVVVTADQSRGEVMRACQGGEEAIVDLVTDVWMARIPPETRSILESLALSVEEEDAAGGDSGRGEEEECSYLVRAEEERTIPAGAGKPSTKKAKGDPSKRIKELFAALVKEGMDPNAAAAEAIQAVALERKEEDAAGNAEPALEPGSLGGSVSVVEGDGASVETTRFAAITAAERVARLAGGGDGGGDGAAAVRTVLSTAKKYLRNVEREPWNPKFRNFRMSNKVFDRIMATAGGVDLLHGLGFDFYVGGADFTACVPLAADAGMMGERAEEALGEFGGGES